MDKHSPTPWRVVHGPARGFVILDAGGEAVAATLDPAHQRSEADAALVAEAALDAPARNCDKYGADGAAVACRKALGIDWSHIILVRKVIGWLFSTEGGAE